MGPKGSSKEGRRSAGNKDRSSKSAGKSAARTAAVVAAQEVFARMAAGQRRLGLARQARRGVEALWATGRLSLSVYSRKLLEVDETSVRFEALVEGVVQRGKLRDWNARSERPLRTPEQWADAFAMLMDFRNIYERIYRGAPVFAAPVLGTKGRRELAAHCGARSYDNLACAPPCRAARVGLLRRKRCAPPPAAR
jgi:hypothetical protein